MSTNQKTYFLFESPYWLQTNAHDLIGIIPQYLDEIDRSDEMRIRNIVLKFGADEGYLTKSENDNLILVAGDQMGSFRWNICTMNFRSLVDHLQYSNLIKSMTMGSDLPIDKIIDLHTRLGALFDTQILNSVVNRVMNSISRLPFDTKGVSDLVTWRTIHTETPFIWLVIYLQMLMRTESTRQLFN